MEPKQMKDRSSSLYFSTSDEGMSWSCCFQFGLVLSLIPLLPFLLTGESMDGAFPPSPLTPDRVKDHFSKDKHD